MGAISAQGSTLSVSTTLSGYQNIGGLTEFVEGDGTASRLDASNLASTQKVYIAGLKDSGARALKGQWLASDPGQHILKSNAGNGVVLHFKAELPDGTTSTFDAEVADFTESPGVDKVLEFNCTYWPTNYHLET